MRVRVSMTDRLCGAAELIARRGIALLPNDSRADHPETRGATFEIVEQGHAIRCLVCGHRSANPEDVRRRFCPHCADFHPIERCKHAGCRRGARHRRTIPLERLGGAGVIVLKDIALCDDHNEALRRAARGTSRGFGIARRGGWFGRRKR